MAQSRRVKADRHKKPRPPLDAKALERLALSYVGRYATTRAKLRAYVARKLAERGWGGEGEAPVEPLVERLVRLGYIDDRAFAAARAASLQRRGYGARRVDQALHGAGIDPEDSGEARQIAQDGAWEAALRYAERRRIGPFAAAPPDRQAREKAFAAMMRAGHPVAIARRLIEAPPGHIPDSDSF